MTLLMFFVGYSVLIIIFGKYAFDRISGSKGFYIADGSLGLFVGVCTFVATWFSARGWSLPVMPPAPSKGWAWLCRQ